MAKEKRRVVVAGATGYLGGHVVRALKEQGHFVRALVRDASRLGEAGAHVDEVFEGQATQPESLVGLGEGIDTFFTSIGVRQLSRRPTFWQVDRDANLALLAEAERAGANHFIATSVFGARAHRTQIELFEAKEQVVDRLRTSSLRYSVVRPTGLFNDMAEFFNMATRGRVWLFGDGAAEVNPVHGADVADLVVRLVDADASTEVDVGGPEVFAMREIGDLAFELLGGRPRFAALPLGVLRAATAITAPFNPNLAALLAGFHFVNSEGAVAPVSGRHLLRSFFMELASLDRSPSSGGHPLTGQDAAGQHSGRRS